MRLFLDSSVVLAACGRSAGASRAIFNLAIDHDWSLLSSSYVISEVDANIHRFTSSAIADWQRLGPQVTLVQDYCVLPLACRLFRRERSTDFVYGSGVGRHIADTRQT